MARGTHPVDTLRWNRSLRRIRASQSAFTPSQRRRIGLPLSRRHKLQLLGIVLLLLTGVAIGAFIRFHLHLSL